MQCITQHYATTTLLNVFFPKCQVNNEQFSIKKFTPLIFGSLPNFSLTADVKFRDISTFSTQVVALNTSSIEQLITRPCHRSWFGWPTCLTKHRPSWWHCDAGKQARSRPSSTTTSNHTGSTRKTQMFCNYFPFYSTCNHMQNILARRKIKHRTRPPKLIWQMNPWFNLCTLNGLVDKQHHAPPGSHGTLYLLTSCWEMLQANLNSESKVTKICALFWSLIWFSIVNFLAHRCFQLFRLLHFRFGFT